MSLYDLMTAAARSVADEADERIRTLTADLDAAATAAEAAAVEMQRLRGLLDTAQADATGLRAALAECREHSADLTARVAQAEATITALRARIAELETQTPPTALRDPVMHPYTSESLWNTSLGSGATFASLSDPVCVQFRRYVDPADGVLKRTPGTVNFGTYTTAVHYTDNSGAPLTIRNVAAGTWGPRVSGYNDTTIPGPASITLPGDMATSITVTTYAGTSASGGAVQHRTPAGASISPDGHFAVINKGAHTAVETFKTQWAPTSTTDPAKRVADPAGRTLIARAGSVRTIDLRGDGLDRGNTAGRLAYLGGLIRTHEIARAAEDPRGAIPHAARIALHLSQMRRPSADTNPGHPAWVAPGIFWPASGVDAHAEGNSTSPGYTGDPGIWMGSHWALRRDWDFESDPRLAGNPEGIALCWMARDYGCYVVDVTRWGPTLCVEQGAPTDACTRAKTAWQGPILENMVLVTNNSPQAIGGPGARLRPPAAPLAPLPA